MWNSKQGKVSTGTKIGATIGSLLVVSIVALIFVLMKGGGTQETSLPVCGDGDCTGQESYATCPVDCQGIPLKEPGQCTYAPSITTLGKDIAIESNVTPSNFQYRVNGKYVGSVYSTPAKDATIEVMADPTGYLAAKGYLPGETVNTIDCGANNFAFDFKNYANVTETIYDSKETGILTNSLIAGTTNESLMTTSKTFKVHLEGNADKYTGNILKVVELPSNSNANVSSVTLTGCGATVASIPNCVSSTNTNAYRTAFLIPELDGQTTRDCYLKVTLVGGKQLQGNVYTTNYAEQIFKDTDGTFKEGTCDAKNVAKYQDVSYYNFVINAA